MIQAAFLLALQLLLVGVLFALAQSGSARHPVLQRYFGPVSWFSAFYVFWFVLPQLVALGDERFIVGFAQITADDRLLVLQQAQRYLVLFLMAVCVGYAPIALAASGVRAEAQPMPLHPAPNWGYALAMLGTGLVAFGGLGLLVMAGEARSEAVATRYGQLLYALSFCASFGAAYLAGHLWLRGQRVMMLALLLLFAAIAFSTGARGRVLWPLVFVVVFVWAASGQRLSPARIMLACAALLLALSLLDPVFIALRLQDADRLLDADVAAWLGPLLYGRNFDGLGNFATIVVHDRIVPTPSVLWLGARELYMSTYFPHVYARGVGFPPTVPGELWIAGGRAFLLAGGVFYGILLGVLDQYVRRIRHEEQFWLFIVLIPWLSAVGSTLTESLAKLLAAALPVLGLMLYRRMMASVMSMRA